MLRVRVDCLDSEDFEDLDSWAILPRTSMRSPACPAYNVAETEVLEVLDVLVGFELQMASIQS